jgi:hypothetical protein
MTRPAGAVNRSNRGKCHEARWGGKLKAPLTLEEMSEEERQQEAIRQIDHEVLASMSPTNHHRLTQVDPNNLGPRQLQAAGAEYRAALANHPAMRRRTVVEALADPMTFTKIVSSESPKELHIDAEVKHSIVVVPAQLTAEAWDAEVLALEDKSDEEKPW